MLAESLAQVPGAAEVAHAGQQAASTLSQTQWGALVVVLLVLVIVLVGLVVWMAREHGRDRERAARERLDDWRTQSTEAQDTLGAIRAAVDGLTGEIEQSTAATTELIGAIRTHDGHSAATAQDVRALREGAALLAVQVVRQVMPDAIRLTAGEEPTRVVVREVVERLVREAIDRLMPLPPDRPDPRRRGGV